MTTKRLIMGVRVLTEDPEWPWARAVVTEGDRILFVGDTPPAASGDVAEIIVIAGGLVLPGFIDGHDWRGDAEGATAGLRKSRRDSAPHQGMGR